MKKICFISGSSPEFLGGVSLYQRNLINYSKKQKLDLEFTWIYPGKENKEYSLEGIRCIEVKSKKYPILKEFNFAKKVEKFLQGEMFDIINTHANWGYCLRKYKKKNNQKIIHTYHGVTYPYMKIQFARFGFLKYLFYPFLPFFYFIEKPPIKKADEIICVSEKVKNQLEKIYGKIENDFILRTGVDLSKFKKISKEKVRKYFGLNKKNIIGLYSGRGGYWNKGLDRAISLGKEVYKKNKNFRLIVLGADKKKCEKYLKENFVIYRGIIERENIQKYYSVTDFFFLLSRYEGGAPPLALSEAISSECLTICSKDSNPEILNDKKDCLILEKYGEKQAKEILDLLKDKKKVKFMKESAKIKIIDLALDIWGKKYFKILLK